MRKGNVMKKVSCLFFLMMSFCFVVAAGAAVESDSQPSDGAQKQAVSYRDLLTAPATTTFVSLDAYKDKTPVTYEQLQHSFIEMLRKTNISGGRVLQYHGYSVFKEFHVTWAGETSAAVTLVQWLYENGAPIDSIRTTYFFTLGYSHDEAKGVHEVRCSVNNMVAELRSNEGVGSLRKYRGAQFWPPLAEEQDSRMVSLLNKEYRYFFNSTVRFDRVEPFHEEVITDLAPEYIVQMLRQQLPAKRTNLTVTNDGAFWGDEQIITITPEDGQYRVTGDFTMHYTVSMDGVKLRKSDNVPYSYLSKTFAKSLARSSVQRVEMKSISKYTMEEYLRQIGGFVFSE